jgi:SAM-dependent methyltransferase
VNLAELQRHWDAFGERDPLGSILADPGRIGGRWDRQVFFETGRTHVERFLAHAREIGCAPAYSRALDFGCGVGRVTQALANRFAEVHGVDIAASMVRLAAAYNGHGQRCIYHVNERPDLRLFPDGMFDLVHSHITLQHMERRYVERYLPELLRVLHPAGTLVFQLPSRPRVLGKPPAVVVKDFLKALGPQVLLEAYRRLAWPRAGTPVGPRMEMHGVHPRPIARLLRLHGGRIVDLVRDDAAAPGWASFQYFVVKGGESRGRWLTRGAPG